MKSDRFLLFLLIGIALLVVLAVGLYLVRSGAQQTYGDESTPEGVLRNYILAVQNQDWQRAYSYLSDTTQNKPTLTAFQSAMTEMQENTLRTGVEIGDVTISDDSVAVIAVTLIHNTSGIFNTPYREVQSVTLLREKGKWKLSSIPYPYANWGWYGNYYDKVVPEPVPED